MNKHIITLSLFIGAGCFLSQALGSMVKVWDFSQSSMPSGELSRWPGNGCTLASGSPELTPDGKKTLEITVGKELDGTGIAARQLIFNCPNLFRVGQRVKVSFQLKSSAPTSLCIMAGQRNAPYGTFNTLNAQDVAVNSDWKNFSWEFRIDRIFTDQSVALPRLMLGKTAAGTRIWLGAVSVEEISGAEPIDINGVVNMGFVDPIAGDGKGGWSDQGAENDFKKFNFHQKSFCGIPMSIIDPEKNHGKSVISLRCPQFTAGPEQVTIPVIPPAGGKYLYVLHTLCWAPFSGASVGEIKVIAADGTIRKYPVVSGVDLRDWWNPRKAENGMVGYEINNLGLYLSRFSLPEQPVKEITLTSSGQGLWIVVGMTICSQEAKAASADVTVIKAGNDWKAIDTADLAIKPGSALDLSGLADHSPGGTFGRVIVNSAGRFVFEKKPEDAIRFRSSAVIPGPGGMSKMSHQQLTELAETISRQGYNLVRLHFLDCWLTEQERAAWKQVAQLNLPVTAETVRFNPELLDRLEFFIAELKKRGIYLYLDAMTSYLGYALDANLYVYGPHHESVAQVNLFGDSVRRSNWKAGVTKLLTHVNPYTGMMLRDDPVLAVLLFCNEQDLLPGNIKSTPAVLHPAWKKFLEQKYHSFDALYQAWNGKYGEQSLDRAGGFAMIPLLDANVSYGSSPAGIDTTLFFAVVEKEMTEFYQQSIRELGYKGLTTQWDFVPRLLEIPARALNPVVSMHNYHAHPSSYINPGSRISQDSSLRSGGNGFKQYGPTRLLNRPFMIMEFGLVFWNRYRHEQGLLFGAGSALQDYNALNLHGGTARLSNGGQEMRPFNNTAIDPVNRASELVTAFAYLRRDVATARHTIAFAVDDKYIFSGKAMNAFSDDLSKLWTVSRFGMIYREDLMAPGKTDMVLNPGNTSRLKYQVGAAGTESSPNQTDSLVSAVAELRRAKLLDKSNRSEPEKGILQSDTGEIVLNIPQGMMTVTAPRLEGATMKQDQRMVLGQVIIEKCSVPASVTVISLDKDAAIDRSTHLLVVFSTDALNTDMQFANVERTELLNIGKLPVLMQTGKLSLTIARAGSPASATAYALKLNGERAEKIPCRLESGKIMLDVDTAKLSSGPTPFFEIVQD